MAFELCRTLRPDVVTLDMMLSGMDGLAATEHIMAHVPTPILIVSASTNRAELFKTYDALAAGAVDVLEKPQGDEFESLWGHKLVSAVKLVAKIRVITHPRARLGALARKSGDIPATAGASILTGQSGASKLSGQYRVVAIGASTGGPAAIVEVLRALRLPPAVPVLLVVHIGEAFASHFADWLDSQSSHRVSYARGGEPLSSVAGRVTMAPPLMHMSVEAGRLRLTADAPRHSCRPSVDVLFESLARDCGSGAIGCLMTGMGRDGAAGLLAMRRAGGFTIAQNEATSIVYGMPREAVLLDAAERVLPLGNIGPTITELLTGSDCRNP
jgi:two-component system chemotaxis response regulator CheB